MNILIVDDDMATVDAILHGIVWSKFHVTKVFTAYNISKAKKILEQNTISIVICDIEMPMGSGLDLLKWTRENEYENEFIFLTCHESFEFASIAIEYKASSYVVKPFNVERMEAELYKSVQKIRKVETLQEYSEYGKYWIENREYVGEGFWRELFFGYVIPDMDVIKREINHRKLNISVEDKYSCVLISVGSMDDIPSEWGNGLLEYFLSKFSVEVILDKLRNEQMITYYARNCFYVLVILDSSYSLNYAKDKCSLLIKMCNQYLNRKVTCYISNFTSLDLLSKVREKLEQLDYNNVVSKGKIFFENDEVVLKDKEKHILDLKVIEVYLSERKKIDLLKLLKTTMEGLAKKKQLDVNILHSLQQDLLQVVYVYLYRNGIAANELFADEVSIKMHQTAINSVIDMMKWQTYLINKTIDYGLEVKKSESMIEKIKHFIHSNYSNNITRTEVAAFVYLTPEYLAKLFKKETGINIKDYINQYRIEEAKLLLAQSEKKISDIAIEVGFDNFSYFTTLFKKSTGMAPNDYRKSLR